jgi:outer membrane protein W
MQKIIIVILLITSVLNENSAQIQKGSWMLGGDLQWDQKSTFQDFLNVVKTNQIASSADAEVGYFLSDRWAVGARVGFNYSNRLDLYNNLSLGLKAVEADVRNYHLAPFARYYFSPKSKFKTFYELSIGGNWDRSELMDYNNNSTGDVFNNYALNVKNTLGVNYFLTQNIALEAAIDYNYFYRIIDSRFAGLEPYFPKAAFNPKFGIKVFLNTEKENAQILAERYLKKGNITIGLTSSANIGSLNYGHFAPSVGYFLTDKWLISSSLSIFHQPKALTVATVMPELRYYQPISPTTQLFFRGAGILATMVNRRLNPSEQVSKNSVEAGIGLNRFIAPNLSIQGSANLNAAKENRKLEVSPNVKIGFQYFIKKNFGKNRYLLR